MNSHGQLAPTAAPRFSYTAQQQQLVGHHGHHQAAPAASTRPVTVRSVKRRDKAKTEEKRIMQQTHSNPGTPRVNLRNEDNAAVMV